MSGDLPLPEALQARIDAGEGSSSLAVLLVDCGLIGRVDGLWGYPVGDAVRGRVSSLLRTEVLREGDLLEQMGREDVACVLGGVGDPAVALLAAEKTLRALSAAFFIGEDEIFASPAIGVALCPAHGNEAQVLLQRAKSACTAARGLPARIACFENGSDAPGASSFLLENRLRTVVAEDALVMLFQPQYDLRLGQIMGAECQLRWPDPALGLVGSEQAFAAAQSAGVVTELLSSILNRALRNISEFRYSAGLDLRVSVRLPSRVLLNAQIPEVVQRALATWSLRAGRLNFEIGETSVLRAEPLALETLARLKAVGVRLTMDDEALALTSLFEFAALPFQEIKVDVSAAGDFAAGTKSERIMQSLVELAHHLKLYVVACGVPDEERAGRLKELGCDYFQGDFKGPALDPKGFIARYGFTE